jgi:hypothetical protein
MKTLKCNKCGMNYFSDSFVGFDCDHCPGELIELTEEEAKQVWTPGSFNSDVDHPCVSC